VRFKPVRKAVFPVAGLGTRFLPATKAMPKEMLPVVDKPLIQYAVEEAAAAGIEQMIFVTGRNKRAIEDHFDRAPELEQQLAGGNKQALLDALMSATPRGVSFVYVRQPEPLGLGHAVLCALPVVNDEPFAVILADDLIDAQPGVTAQLVQTYERYGASAIAVQDVPRADTGRYGIVATESLPDGQAGEERVRAIVEKPQPEDAPSTLAAAAAKSSSPTRSPAAWPSAKSSHAASRACATTAARRRVSSRPTSRWGAGRGCSPTSPDVSSGTRDLRGCAREPDCARGAQPMPVGIDERSSAKWPRGRRANPRSPGRPKWLGPGAGDRRGFQRPILNARGRPGEISGLAPGRNIRAGAAPSRRMRRRRR